MASASKHDPQYLIQEPTSGLYLSGERLAKRPGAARFPSLQDAALALQDLPAASQPLEIVRADA